MYIAVQAVFNTFQSVLQQFKRLAAEVECFTNAIDQIESRETEYSSVSKGATSQKNDIRDSLVEETNMVCGILHTYALDIEDAQLKDLTDVTETGLDRLRDADLALRTKGIAEIAVNQKDKLQDYGLTPDLVDGYQQLVISYCDSLEQKDSKIASSVAAREELTEAFTEADRILKTKLDELMKLQKKLNPDFFNRYSQARVIKDLGIRRTKAEESMEMETV